MIPEPWTKLYVWNTPLLSETCGVQPTTTVEHILCPGQDSDKEWDSQVGAEAQRAEVQCPASLRHRLFLFFPMKKAAEKYWRRGVIAAVHSQTLVWTREESRTCLVICDHQTKQLPLPPKPPEPLWPFPVSFPLSHGSGPKLKHTEGFGTAASSQALLSLAVPCEVLWPTGPALLSEYPQHLQPVEGRWRTSHQEHERGGGGSSWLSAKPHHSAFSFLVSALCWKVSTYAPVSMATAFLAFLLQH